MFFKKIFEQDSGVDADPVEEDHLNESIDDSIKVPVDHRFDDPLGEPIIRMSLKQVKISPTQLIEMSVKELNKRLIDSPSFIVSKLKRCRRTLKNRGYAKNCRIKRIAAKNQLEQVNMSLSLEIRELRQINKRLEDQLNQLKLNQMTTAFESAGQLSETNQSHSIYTNHRQQTYPNQIQHYDNNVYTGSDNQHNYQGHEFGNMICESTGFFQHSCNQQQAC